MRSGREAAPCSVVWHNPSGETLKTTRSQITFYLNTQYADEVDIAVSLDVSRPLAVEKLVFLGHVDGEHLIFFRVQVVFRLDRRDDRNIVLGALAPEYQGKLYFHSQIFSQFYLHSAAKAKVISNE